MASMRSSGLGLLLDFWILLVVLAPNKLRDVSSSILAVACCGLRECGLKRASLLLRGLQAQASTALVQGRLRLTLDVVEPF